MSALEEIRRKEIEMKYRRKRLKERSRTNAARGGEPRLRIRLSRPLSIKNSQATVRCEMTQFTIYAKGNPEEERSLLFSLIRPYRVYINEPRINRVKPVGEQEPINQIRLGLFVGRPETRLVPSFSYYYVPRFRGAPGISIPFNLQAWKPREKATKRHDYRVNLPNGRGHAERKAIPLAYRAAPTLCPEYLWKLT